MHSSMKSSSSFVEALSEELREMVEVPPLFAERFAEGATLRSALCSNSLSAFREYDGRAVLNEH